MPTIPSDCIKIRFTMDLDGNDIAVFGVNGHLHHITGNTIDWQEYMQDAAEKARDKWVQHLDPITWTPVVTAVKCEAYHLDTAGKVLDKGLAGFTGPAQWKGSAGGGTLPWETSLCVSIYGYEPGSFTRYGASKRGRFYLPPMPVSAVTGVRGHLHPSTKSQLIGDLGDFLNDIEGMVLGPSGQGADYFELGIISASTNKGATPNGSFTRAVKWGFDDRFDSQRRRENKDVVPKTWGDIDREP